MWIVSAARGRDQSLLITALLFVYVFWFRVHGLDERFGLHVDQIRDWDLALRHFSALPLTGVPSTAGGHTAGPAYYWVLWLVAHTIGPLFERLPHAGGYGLAFLQSAADACLLLALSRHLQAPIVALAVVLLCATAGLDAALASTIWNPPVAEMFAKIAIALTLLRPERVAWTIGIAASGWMAVHAHTSGFIVAVPLFLLITAQAATRHGIRRGVRDALIIAAVVGSLQIPWLVSRRLWSGETSSIESSVQSVVDAPLERLHVGDSATSLVRAINVILFFNRVPGWLLATALAGGGVVLAASRSTSLVVCGPGVLMTGIAVFALWQGPLAEVYWYLPLIPSGAICLIAWAASVPAGQWRTAAASAALIAILAAQPARATAAWTLHTSPYGPLLSGTRALIAMNRPVSAIRTTFALPAGTQAEYLYSLLGGRLEITAPVAVLDNSGGVAIEE